MEIDPSRIIISMINFAILYFILRHYLFKPVNSVIESREKGISEKISTAEKNSVEAEQLRLQRETSLKLLEEEGKRIMEDYKYKAEQVSEEIISGAKEEARVIIDRAKLELHREQEKVKEELRTEIVELSLMFAEKALAGSLDENMHRKLVNDFILKVDN